MAEKRLDIQNVSLVFFSSGMFQKARQLKSERPRLNVVLLTVTPNGLDEVARGVKVFGKTNPHNYDWGPLMEAILE